eukprot:9496484-Pyramimonas_sp.AAC.2
MAGRMGGGAPDAGGAVSGVCGGVRVGHDGEAAATCGSTCVGPAPPIYGSTTYRAAQPCAGSLSAGNIETSQYSV